MDIAYSVVIPAYNEEAWLPDTLDALQNAMGLLDRNGEIIVVDNNSNDRTAAVAVEQGATVVFEPVNQISKARNAGAGAANGRYLIFLDADTRISAETLGIALENLDSGFCCGGGGRVDFGNDSPALARIAARFWNWFSIRLGMAAGCFLYCRKDAFDEVGGFSLGVYASEEIWFSRQLRAWGKQNGMDFRIIRDPPLITSGRKLGWFSPLQLVGLFIIFSMFPLAVRFRALCGFWYHRPGNESSGGN